MTNKGGPRIAIALVVVTLLALLASASGVIPAAVAAEENSFPEWVNFYGINSTFNGEPLPVGSTVTAYFGSQACGTFQVHTPGQYGLLACYRGQPGQPGPQPGDTIHFTVNGFEAIMRGPDEAVWTANGDRKHVELEASGTPQTPTGTPTQTTMPTSTRTPTSMYDPPTATTPTSVVPPTSTPTQWHGYPTPSPTWWYYPTATPICPPSTPECRGVSCRSIILDGGFEAGGYWTAEASPVPAARSTAQVRSGFYSARLGIEGAPNVQGLSAIRQQIAIPVDATSALLSFHYFQVSGPNPGADHWEALLLEPGTNRVVAVLWRTATDNERQWRLINFDLSAFRGRCLDLYLNVYNDGIGGASAVYVDDVDFVVCTPIVATPTPTPIQPTTCPILSPTPYPTPGGTCVELVVNGGFEAGTQGWQLGRTERMAERVTEPRFEGTNAMRLGFVEGTNVKTFSSIRQAVTIPGNAVHAVLTFWVYPMSTDSGTVDHQELVVLSPADNSTLALPWRVFADDSRAWKQIEIDLTAYRGQSIVLYFNAYNDGVGGKTALVVDNISLKACWADAPTAIPLAASPVGSGPAPATSTPLPTLAAASETLPTDPTATARVQLAVAVGSPGALDTTDGDGDALAMARPTPASSSRSTRADPALVAVIAIIVAIAITVMVFFVVRGGPGRAGGPGVVDPEAPAEPPPEGLDADVAPSEGANPFPAADMSEPPADSGRPPFRFAQRPGRAVTSVGAPSHYRPSAQAVHAQGQAGPELDGDEGPAGLEQALEVPEADPELPPWS